MTFRQFFQLGLVASLSLSAAASAEDPGMFINPIEERRMGIAQHPGDIQRGRGTHPNKRLADYVNSFGARVAKMKAKHPDQFVFTFLNGGSYNAHAQYGGFVYMYAGALVWLSDEAELAAVAGHEVGHSINRHLAKKHSRKTVSGTMSRLAMLRRRNRERAAEIQEAIDLRLITYGQENELESDQVGLSANLALGLDTLGPARAFYKFHKLDEYYATAFRLGSSKPAYLQTHPQPLERVRRSIEFAQTNGGSDLPRNADRYLDMINGMYVVIEFPPVAQTFPRFIRVVSVRQGDTIASLSRRVAMPQPELFFKGINGLENDADLRPGMRVKIVTIK